MKVEFDFCITPGPYNGTGPAPRDQRVRGSVEIPDVPLVATIAAIIMGSKHYVYTEGGALRQARRLICDAEKETT